MENLIDAKSLAEYLDVPLTWVWRAGREGLIPCIRVGKYMRFDKDLVLADLSRVAETERSEVEGHDVILPFPQTNEESRGAVVS